ncbi:hypothetical protein AAA145_16845, partial [Phocaeicola dorei]
LSANSVMRGRLDARRTLKSLVADLRPISKPFKKVISSLAASGFLLLINSLRDLREEKAV